MSQSRNVTSAPLERDRAYDHALALMKAHPLVDAHNDMPWTVRKHSKGDLARYDLTKLHSETDTDIPRLREGKVGTQVFAAFLPTNIPHPATVTLEQIDLILRIEDAHADVFHPVRGPEDIATAHRLGQNRFAAFGRGNSWSRRGAGAAADVAAAWGSTSYALPQRDAALDR